ncbi:uncharacterized protein BDR25DRAFT_60680 [Lindgomyces ingoldianus]|uniref:Uncharacterized protein n=1 Tax=Lindgomyces ingoldianus TaxID=673940 RepID=A0ACB6QPA0_9PLEO|nr:uncharacterized protein BDR25DRAFT_60680 [Lindgomyces ingoldianus]KAF2467945.1 hypothetical protein BDR25DRAFT_60680 [Lindgomyces ingoldianus]
MLPTAGLFLPESLYPKQTPTTDSVETRSVRRKSFEWRNVEKTSRQDVSNIFSSISTVFNFVDFVAALNEVPSESEIFVNLIQRVRQDVSEALRLHACNTVSNYFETFPQKKIWIDSILLDIQRALNDIGVYVEDVRDGGDEGGAARMKHRFEWVLSHHQKLISREIALNTCHQSLMAAIQAMQAVEMVGQYGDSANPVELPVPQPPELPWLQDNDILRSPYSRQKWRMSQRNLSLPSITVSEVESDRSRADSVNSSPVELPGSTPEDLPDPDNWDLYAPPPNPRRFLDQAPPPNTLTRKPLRFRELPPPLPKTLGTLKLARRYRPKAVEVRRPMIKHNSLPTRLPSLPRQPSLYMELAQYVIPSNRQKNDPSFDTLVEIDTPATSVTPPPSGPSSATSCPEGLLTKEVRINSAPVVISVERAASNDDESFVKDCAADVRDISSSKDPRFTPSTSLLNYKVQSESETVSLLENRDILPPKEASDTGLLPEAEAVSQEFLVESEAAKEDEPRPMSKAGLAQQEIISDIVISENLSAAASLESRIPGNVLQHSQETQKQLPQRPMTAQSKRRRAQSRRMHIAYGSD